MEIMGHVRQFSVWKKKSIKGVALKACVHPFLTQEFNERNALNFMTDLLSFLGGMHLVLYPNTGEMFSSESVPGLLLRGWRRA